MSDCACGPREPCDREEEADNERGQKTTARMG